MNCDQVKELLADYWSRSLSPRDQGALEGHFERCAACREESEALGALWQKVGLLPATEPVREPGPDLRARFYQSLEAYQEGIAEGRKHSYTRRLAEAWRALWPQRPAFQFAGALAMLAVGLAVGWTVRSTPAAVPNKNGELAQLREELSGMRQLVTLSLLQQQSSSERLRGVSYAYQAEKSDVEVLAALLQAVNHDPNVNVRLAAVDALANFAASPVARRGIVQAIAKQDSPLVQIALLDQVVQMREKSAVPELQKLSTSDTMPEVKQRAQWALGKLQ
jgi:hypothetical protein